jgi:glycosyltransferase involved in cell wall biosynthesis
VRPRLVFLVTLAETGGAQTYVASLLPALVGTFDVVVAAHGDGPLREAAGSAGAQFVSLHHVRRPISLWREPLGLLELLRLLRQVHPDLVHVNSAKAAALGRLAAWLAGVPIRVYTVHGWAFLAHRGLVAVAYRWVERALRPLTTVTVCVSENERRAGLAARACDEETTIVIRNGVSPRSVGGAERGSAPRRLVMVGRLQAPKDPITLVRALGLVRGPDYEALLVGDGPERALVEEEIARLGIGSAVRLLGERTDVPELLAEADVFVLSTRSEGLPLSVLEAMAAGLPVIASNVGGIPELVLDGVSGVLVPPGDPGALAEAIERLLEDPSLALRLGEAARRRVAESFELKSVQEAHLALYRRMLATRGLPRRSP